MSVDTGQSNTFCNICHAGSFKPYRATYARWHDGHFVVVPGMPAWRCDFCSDTVFESGAINRLILLLGPESNSENQQRWRTTGLEEYLEAGLGNRHRI